MSKQISRGGALLLAVCLAVDPSFAAITSYRQGLQDVCPSFFLQQALSARARLSGVRVIHGVRLHGLRSIFAATRIPNLNSRSITQKVRQFRLRWPIRWDPVPTLQPIDQPAFSPAKSQIPSLQRPWYFAQNQNESGGSSGGNSADPRIQRILRLLREVGQLPANFFDPLEQAIVDEINGGESISARIAEKLQLVGVSTVYKGYDAIVRKLVIQKVRNKIKTLVDPDPVPRSILDLRLSANANAILIREGVESVGLLRQLTEVEVLILPDAGRRTLANMKERLWKVGQWTLSRGSPAELTELGASPRSFEVNLANLELKDEGVSTETMFSQVVAKNIHFREPDSPVETVGFEHDSLGQLTHLTVLWRPGRLGERVMDTGVVLPDGHIFHFRYENDAPYVWLESASQKPWVFSGYDLSESDGSGISKHSYVTVAGYMGDQDHFTPAWESYDHDEMVEFLEWLHLGPEVTVINHDTHSDDADPEDIPFRIAQWCWLAKVKKTGFRNLMGKVI